MSANLDEFLGLQDVSDVRKTIKVTTGGKTFDFVIRPVTEEEHGDYQRQSNNVIKNKVTFDLAKYNKLLLSNHIVEPNFNDAEFLKKAKCQTGYEFMTKKFNAGILTDIASEIQNISGFNSIELEIEEAKN
jgi:hypothetical protein